MKRKPLGEGEQEYVFNLAKRHFENKEYAKAIGALRNLLNVKDFKAKALTSIGASLFHLNHYRAAKKYLTRALAIQPDYPIAHFNLANTLFALGDYEKGAIFYGNVVKEDSGNDAAWQGKFDCLFIRGQTDDCEIVVKEWKQQLPYSNNSRLSEALLLRRQGNNNKAIRVLNETLKSDPENSRIYALVSEILVDLKQFKDALAYIEQAIRIDPKCISYYCTKAGIHYFLSQVSECAKAYGEASALSPTSATLLLNQYLLFPTIPSSSEEIERCRIRFLEGLSLVENNPEIELFLHHPSLPHTFPLAYHNRNDRQLLERYMKLMKRLADPLLEQWAGSSKPLSSHKAKLINNKVRIGFLSQHFSGHSNTMAFQGLIRHLNRDKFVVVLIHVAGSQKDETQENLNSCCDEVINLSEKGNEACSALHDLSLDILYFTDMGMTPYDYMLPFIRSCDIQLTGWGIPHTSGNSAIDFYISAEGIEPPNADDHYTETLVLLPGGLPCCFLADRQEVPSFPREYFFLPSHCQLIGCLQALHKLHPDYDLVMEQIAQNNPEAIFVFVEDATSHSTELFLQRLSNHAPAVREQSFFLRLMGRGEYQALCKCMDILLDPIYYGSGITFFEAALVGTPVITLEGSYLRSRTVSSGYREMGLENAPVAHSISEYIDLATNLLEDHSKRENLRHEILARNHLLFNRMDYVRSFEEFCLSVTTKHSTMS